MVGHEHIRGAPASTVGFFLMFCKFQKADTALISLTRDRKFYKDRSSIVPGWLLARLSSVVFFGTFERYTPDRRYCREELRHTSGPRSTHVVVPESSPGTEAHSARLRVQSQSRPGR